VLAEAGYVVKSFDYKGWDDSEGPKSRLAPYSRVAGPDEYHDLLTRAAADRDKRVRGTKAATPWRPESSDRCSGSGYWSNATKRFQTMSSEIAIFIERHTAV
jgi:hypothetical protein